MAKLNGPRPTRTTSTGAIQASEAPTGTTHEGAPGYGRDPQSALFLMAVSAFAGEGTFYESTEVRDARFKRAVEDCMQADPDWVAGFLPWLRTDGKIRTASILGAVHACAYASRNKLSGFSRPLINAVLRRPDEPGEFVAAWRTQVARSLPGGVQRGVADAVVRLYTEQAVIKYDSDRSAYRFGDVVELTHPTPGDMAQAQLFESVISARHGRRVRNLDRLPMMRAYRSLNVMPQELRRELYDRQGLDSAMSDAGMTWESLSGWFGGPLDEEAWSSVLDRMGILAIVRNLRSFDEAGVQRAFVQRVVERLTNPDRVYRSGILPMQLHAAYRQLDTDRWSEPLGQALDATVPNVPALPGKTLILMDCSNSMEDRMSKRGQITRMDAAALFASALAVRADNADLVRYGTTSERVKFRRGASALRLATGSFPSMGGTNTEMAIRSHFDNHDRVILLTDEQAAWPAGHRFHGYSADIAYNKPPLPDSVHFHVWNFAGYENAGSPAGKRHYWWGGLSDDSFRMIESVERGQTGWPFNPVITWRPAAVTHARTMRMSDKFSS